MYLKYNPEAGRVILRVGLMLINTSGWTNFRRAPRILQPRKPQPCSAFLKTWAKKCTWQCMTNWAPLFRADILNLHRLDDASLEALLERLNNNELDDYLDIGTLMCRAFFDVFSLPVYFPATAFAAWCEATSTGISRYCSGNRFFRPAIFGKSNCAI
jgi:hypothetical protein